MEVGVAVGRGNPGMGNASAKEGENGHVAPEPEPPAVGWGSLAEAAARPPPSVDAVSG